jgi:hypothetical protein
MRSRAWVVAGPLLVAAAVAGCGRKADGIDRQAVSGEVTLDGKPLADGSITFSPTGDGPSAGGTITGGRYAIAQAEGPAPGSYKVVIQAMQPTGKKLPDSDHPGKTVDEMTNVVPEAYNARTELTAEVKKGGPNTFNFPLSSKARASAGGGGKGGAFPVRGRGRRGGPG